MRTLKKIALAAALGTATLVAAPASATIILVNASTIQGANVLFNTGTQTGTMVTGSTQQGTAVNFTGTTVAGNVISANGGQARVEGEGNITTSNPNDTLGLTSLNFSLANNVTFNNLEFNLFGGAGSANIVITDNAGEVFTFNQALGNGENFFGFVGIDGQSIRSVAITTAGGIQDIRQIRLDQATVAAVPEPGTWALMLVGFGAVGASLRRRRSKVLAQFA
jgi:hypothetical protein